MGLLQGDERRDLIDRILLLPNIRDARARRSLVAGLPEGLRNSVAASDVPRIEVENIIEVADGETWGHLPDESWSIIKVVENSLSQVRGSRVGAELEKLLNTLKSRAVEPAAPRFADQLNLDEVSSPSTTVRVRSKTMPQTNPFPFEELTNALVSAFPGYEDLDLMVTFKLGTPLAHIHEKSPVPYVALQLVKWAKARGKVDDLIVGALNQNPENPELLAVAEQFNLDEGAGKFERIVIKSVQLADVEDWRAQMMRNERAVCRVEFGGQGVGTGFLVGTSLVLTNYHVVEEVVGGAVKPESVALRFDYKMKVNKTVQKGKEYKLLGGTKWLAASSPVEKLDYALVRVAGKPANESVAAQPGAPTRGFLTPAVYEFKAGDPLFIIQHPKATPLKFAPGSVDQPKVANSRVTYTVNTDEGSSGSPCFTSDWTPVALHHWGGVNHNRGVVFSAILKDWEEKGLSEEVGK